MNICCIGAGHVGGPLMAMIAAKCPDIAVNVVDSNAERIAAWNSDTLPLYEPGLLDAVTVARGRNLHFLEDAVAAIKAADLIFVAVNAPTKRFGLGAGAAIDLRFVESVSRVIAEHAETGKIVVEMSSIPVKTADTIAAILAANARGLEFQVVSNPVFLAKGTAMRDLAAPDRVLIGSERTANGDRAAEVLASIYARWVPRERILTMNLWSAELSKLVANAFLALRISAINSISALCESTGADVDEVADAIGRDARIGAKFLRASVGFGGSCFKKDILNLAYLAENLRLPEVAAFWTQVVTINEQQKHRFARRITSALFNSAADKRIAVLGFAFKKDTNDVRESPAITVCQDLLAERATVAIYDPKVSRKEIELATLQPEIETSRLIFAETAYDACEKAHAVVILTEWDEFKALDYGRIYERMAKPAFVFDGRNILDLQALRQIGFRAFGIGKPE